MLLLNRRWFKSRDTGHFSAACTLCVVFFGHLASQMWVNKAGVSRWLRLPPLKHAYVQPERPQQERYGNSTTDRHVLDKTKEMQEKTGLEFHCHQTDLFTSGRMEPARTPEPEQHVWKQWGQSVAESLLIFKRVSLFRGMLCCHECTIRAAWKHESNKIIFKRTSLEHVSSFKRT